MYRKMLVPLDASEYAECTLDHVKEVASAHKIEQVILLTVVEPLRQPARAYLGGYREEEIVKAGEQAVRDYLEKTRDRLSLSAEVRTDMAHGEPANAIVEYSENNGIDLIVMSTHGRSGPSRWFLGSVASRVLQRSPVPVFLIPSQACRLTA